MPFTGHRIRSASVAWLNRRWFLERGFDLAQERTLRQVSAWLVDEFAWCVQSGSDGVTADTRTLWADRYGSTQGRSPHGGSGRVATVGCFQAKGIGPTPLVGQGDKPGHSHGCLSLEECLREAIYAEVMAAEFPHGAVPAIAILDTGLHFSSPEPDQLYDQNARRGILIRPSVVRPAHAERAPLFKRPIGDVHNSQAADVQRTRDVIAHWMSAAAHETGMNGAMAALEALVRAMVEQIAFGQVQRLFSGGYFSSNVSNRGELLDFGNTHALPNWVHAHVLRLDPGFGKEMELIRPLIGSLAFYFAKYRGRGDLLDLENRGKRVWTVAKETYAQTWRHYALSLFQVAGLDGRTQECVHSVLLEYFRSQQRHRVTYLLGVSRAHSTLPEAGWLYDALIEDQPLPSREADALHRIAGFLKSDYRSTLYLALGTAARLLRPRPSIDRRYLLDTLAAAVPHAAAQRTVDSCAIARLVQHAISAARRHWPRLPEGYVVLAHASREGSSALLCATHPAGARTVWAEGIRDDSGDLHWFGRRIAVSAFPLGVRLDETYWCAMCPVHETTNGVCRVRFADGEMTLPTWDVEYARPAERWMHYTDAEAAISADTPQIDG